jgi:excisionase family DNA binding protein
MNLADAIRRAAQTSGMPLGQTEAASIELKPSQNPSSDFDDRFEGNDLAQEQEMNSLDNHVASDHGHQSELLAGHNVVRLELVLNPEQLKGFFGAVIASQHSVLTLREAAGYLRVSQVSLERLAEEGEVPGMMVDGKWRFTRPALEEWLCTHPKKKEA